MEKAMLYVKIQDKIISECFGAQKRRLATDLVNFLDEAKKELPDPADEKYVGYEGEDENSYFILGDFMNDWNAWKNKWFGE